MKFSDMMGKGTKDTASSVVATADETEATETTENAVPAARHAPPVPEAPIRFGARRADAPDLVESAAEADPAPGEPAPSEPSIMDVMNELTPRFGAPTAAATTATSAQLDATAWLEGLSTIDDDLLPR